jgi:transcriptional regulator with XRE-family HTH domain
MDIKRAHEVSDSPYGASLDFARATMTGAQWRSDIPIVASGEPYPGAPETLTVLAVAALPVADVAHIGGEPKIHELSLPKLDPQTLQPCGEGKFGIGKDGPIEDDADTDQVNTQSYGIVNPDRLGNAIRFARLYGPSGVRMTQVELAKRMSILWGGEVDQATISRLENGERAPSRPMFVALARSLGLTGGTPPETALMLVALNDFNDGPDIDALHLELRQLIAQKCFGAPLEEVTAPRKTRRTK